MMVPQRLPDSLNIVEKRAAPKASIRPTMASRNRTQTCESPKGKRDAVECCALVGVGSEIRLPITSLSGAGRCFCQHMRAAG